MIRRLLTAAVASAAILGGALGAAAQDKEKIVVTLGNTGLSIAPLFIAMQEGYFAEEGLEVELLKLDGGMKPLAALSSGAAQVYMAPLSNVFQARGAGADLLQIGVINGHINSGIVISKEWAETHGITPDSPYEDKLKALKDIRIAVTSLGSSTGGIVRYLAQESGLDFDRDMTVVAVGSNVTAMLAALDNDQVDAFVLSAPAPQLAAKEFGAIRLIDFAKGDVPPLPSIAWNGPIVETKWLQENGETAVKLLTGLQRAINLIKDPATNEQAKQSTLASGFVVGLDPAIIDDAWAELGNLVPTSLAITEKMAADSINFSNVFSEEKYDPAVAAQYFDSTYAAKAIEAAGTVAKTN